MYLKRTVERGKGGRISLSRHKNNDTFPMFAFRGNFVYVPIIEIPGFLKFKVVLL